MNLVTRFNNSAFATFYRSFSSSGRAVIWFAVPFTLLDAIHYYTAGTALLISFPLLLMVYVLCGAVAAALANQTCLPKDGFAKVGRKAGFQLWLTSTTVNSFIIVILGIASLGAILLSSAVYLCLFAPLHAVGSALGGQLGGWLYQQYARRTSAP